MRTAVRALAIAGIVACAPAPAAAPAPVADELLATVAPPARAEAHAPRGGRSELRRFTSAALGREMPYWAYVPASYDADDRGYPVLYLLHGMGGSYDEWRSFGVFDAAERLIAAGEIQPLIIVLPQGDRGYWMDHADGSGAWGRYTAEDLVREVDSRYRTIATAAARAIGGVSMGAHGALQLAMNHPGTFAVVGAHSVALRGPSQALPFFGRGKQFAERDPMSLVRSRTDVARSLYLWIDIGSDDGWTPRARELHRDLERLGVEHEWREWPGDHSGAYWRGHVADYLRYYDSALALCRRGDGTVIVR